MFNGIVERTLKVAAASDHAMGRRLTLATPWTDIRRGESVAVNGCCLTIAEIAPGQISFDIIAESLDKTNLGLVRAGDAVNVERSLRMSDRIDGHFVQGHVDGRAPLIKMIHSENEVRLVIELPKHLKLFVVPKGSVAVDGVSLTVAALRDTEFEVALIPTTLDLTTLGSRPVGWPFNLEADIISKTIVSWLERREG